MVGRDAGSVGETKFLWHIARNMNKVIQWALPTILATCDVIIHVELQRSLLLWQALSFLVGGLLLFLIIRVRCLDNFFFFQFSLICMVQCFFLRCNALPQQMRWCILVNSCNHCSNSLRLLSKFRVLLSMVVLKRWIPCFGTICVKKQ